MLYRITGITSNWWDCGPEVPHGITSHLGRNESGNLQLERAGPAIPAFTVPRFSRLIVTDQIIPELTSQFNCFELSAVKYANVVPLNWQNWSTESPMPEKESRYHMPDFLMDPDEFDDTLIEAMPGAFELIPKVQIELARIENTEKITSKIPDGAHFFDVADSDPFNDAIVSAAAKEWIESRQPKWLKFEELAHVG